MGGADKKLVIDEKQFEKQLVHNILLNIPKLNPRVSETMKKYSKQKIRQIFSVRFLRRKYALDSTVGSFMRENSRE